MSEMHLKQTRSTYSACGPFTKIKERFQIFKETRDSRYIYRNEMNNTCFQHDMAYGDIKDLARRTASDRVLRGKVFNIAKNPKYGYQRGLASMVYTLFYKKTVVLVLKIKLNKMNNWLKNYINQVLKIRKMKVYSSFRERFGVLI